MADSSQSGQNIVHMPDGTTQYFPKEATPDQIQKVLTLNLPQGSAPAGGYNFDPALNAGIDFIRPFVGNLAGSAAAGGVGLLTKNPALALGAETQGYAGVDSLLQMLKAGDQRPADFGEALGEGEKQALINAVTGRIVGGLFRGVNAIRSADQPEIYAHFPTTSQALESFGYNKLATAAKHFEDFGAPGAKSDALDRAGGAGFTQALKFANALNGRMFTINSDPVKLADKIRGTLESGLEELPQGPAANYKSWSKSFTKNAQNPQGGPLHIASQEALSTLQGGRNPFQKLDDVIQDPDRLSKVLAVGQLNGQPGVNVRKDLQAYQFMSMVNKSMSKDAQGNIRLNPDKLNAVWTDPGMQTSLDTLWGKNNRKDVSDFIKNVTFTQDKQNTYPVAKAIRFIDGGFMLGAGLLTGNLHIAGGAGALGGLFVPTAIIGSALTKPGVARFLAAAAGGEPLTKASSIAAHAFNDALQGATVATINAADGSKTWGRMEKDPETGEMKFVPAK